MIEKPTKKDYFSTTLVLVLCTCWAVYDYKTDLDKKIPFEPIISVVSYLIVVLGYLSWKKFKVEQDSNIIEQNAEKIYNIEEFQTNSTTEIEQNADKIYNIDEIKGDAHFNTYIQYADRKIPRFLTQTPVNTDFFIGRDTDLEAIEAEYKAKNHLLVLVNGEGGMGKTTLAAQYWFQHEARYKHLAWIFADLGIANALISLASSLGVQFSPEDKEPEQIARIIAALINLESPCLVVFDNANNPEDLEAHFVTLRRLSNCHIILTSRVTKLVDVPVHRVLPLGHSDAVLVFKEHYPNHAVSDTALLDKLLTAIGSNTLVIELLAKNLAVFNYGDTAYSLEKLVSDLQEKGLFAIQNQKVDVVYHSDLLQKETPEDIIAAMYDLSALPDAEKQILSNFSLLPAENIPYDRFKDLLKPDDSQAFKNSLRVLQQKGWIDYFESSREFKISPVIQQITKLKNRASLLVDCNTLIDSLIDELEHDNIHKENYIYSAIFSRYAETVATAIDEPIYNAALLCERIGNYYTTIGNLDRAIAYYEKCRAISLELCVIKPDDDYFKNVLAISNSKLGNTQASLGNLDIALEYYEEQNKLAKELYAAYPNNVEFKNGLAISFSKLGNTQASLGNLDKALAYYEDQNKLAKELYDAYPTNLAFKNGIAVSYSKLGETQESLGNLDKALAYYEERNRLGKELYSAYPTNVEFKNGIAVSYSKLGEIYASLGNLDKALEYYEEDIKLTKELYDAYPNNVEFKNGLAISYLKLGETQASLGNLDKALEYYEERNRFGKELYAAYPTNVVFKNGLAVSYSKLGETQASLGNLDKALEYYEERNRLGKELYAAYPNNVTFKNGLAVSYSKLGETQASLGNLDKALDYYEEDIKLTKELYDAYPTNVEFKNGLAISYEKLGEMQTSLGNLDKALGYYEEQNKLSQELYSTYPTNVAFKNGLAISYSKLGETQASKGNLNKALKFYEEQNKLSKELFADYPNNVDFKNGLAVSYSKLGQTQAFLGNLDKALEYYEERNKLGKELYAAYPTNVAFKNGLAISYLKLGETQASLGNLDKALEFYEAQNKLGKELYAAYPTNVEFKNGLAVSYYKLGEFSRDKLKNKTKAEMYFSQAEALWLELVRDAPQYIDFQYFLGIVQRDIKDLENE